MRNVLFAVIGTLALGSARAAEPRQVVSLPDAAELRRIAAEAEQNEEAASLALRQRLRFGAFLHLVITPDEPMPPLRNVASIMPELSFGLRYGLGSAFELQARAGIAAPLGDTGGSGFIDDHYEHGAAAACQAAGAGTPNPGHFGDSSTSAGGVTFGLDATLRWHYAGGLVPAFVGLGPWLVIAHLAATGDEEIFCSVDDDFDHDVPAHYRVERSATTVLLGGVFELGTYLGSDEQLELGFRAGFAPGLSVSSDDAFLATLELYFGVMFL